MQSLLSWNFQQRSFQSVSSHYLSFHYDYERFKSKINSPSPKIWSYSENSCLYLVFSIIFQNIALCIFKNTYFRVVNALQEDNLIFDMVTSSYICYLLSSIQIIVINTLTSPSHHQTLLLISINPRRVFFLIKTVKWCLGCFCLFFHQHVFQMLLVHFPQKSDSWIILSLCISLHFQI